MINPITIELPWPPSTNTFLRHVILPIGKGTPRCPQCKQYFKTRSCTLISEAGRDFLRVVDRMLYALDLPLMHGPLAIDVVLHPPNQRVIDLDNRLKAIQDSLKRRPKDEHQTRWLFADDDSQIGDVHLSRGPIVPGGKAVVKISTLAGVEVQPAFFGEET